MAISLVSVPRRGFIVFLLETAKIKTEITQGFSPPKGIHCFSTQGSHGHGDPRPGHQFQSPEGDSLFFYPKNRAAFDEAVKRFSPPKGIHCFSTT